MLDCLAGDIDPAMLALLPYRIVRRRKVAIGKIAHRYGKEGVVRAGMIPKRASACRAEMEVGGLTAVTNMFVNAGLAAYRHRIRREARLKSKCRSAAFLAIIAMADRNPDRFAGAGNAELAAAAGGGAGGHDLTTPNPG